MNLLYWAVNMFIEHLAVSMILSVHKYYQKKIDHLSGKWLICQLAHLKKFREHMCSLPIC